MNVIGYVRVSSEEQARSGLGWKPSARPSQPRLPAVGGK